MKKSKHEDRKSVKQWGKTNQLTSSITTLEHIKATASNNGAFNKVAKRHGY